MLVSLRMPNNVTINVFAIALLAPGATFTTLSGPNPTVLPTGASGQTQSKRDYISVSVDVNGTPYFDKKPVSYEELTSILAKVHQENPEAKVFVRGDRDTVHGNIIRVLDILRSQGFYKIAFEIKSQAAAGVPSAGTGQP